MIPSLLVLGLIFGRWWRATLLIAAIGWSLLLVTNDIMSVEWALAGAAGLAAANALVGVLIHHAFLCIVRGMRGAPGP